MSTKNRENWSYIAQGFYVVRTQAGFRQAIKDYNGGEMDTVYNWPRGYPCLVCLSPGYDGNTFTNVNCIHLKRLDAILREHD